MVLLVGGCLRFGFSLVVNILFCWFEFGFDLFDYCLCFDCDFDVFNIVDTCLVGLIVIVYRVFYVCYCVFR